MGRDRRDRRQSRAQDFGNRHPRLTLTIGCVLLAGVDAICSYQLSYGTYLGRGWLIAAAAGMAAAAGLSAAALISTRRRSRATVRLYLSWAMLAAVSASSIRIPFPQVPYGGVQAFFNVAHAALLGSEAVTCTGLIALFLFLFLRLVLRRHRAAAPRGPARAGHGPGHAGLSARLRWPGTEAATWRAGHLMARDGTLIWRPLKGDAEVDLTSACQAMPTLPAATRGRQPRTTTLATADGLVELDVSPRALASACRQ